MYEICIVNLNKSDRKRALNPETSFKWDTRALCMYNNVKKGTSPRDYFHKNFHLKNFLSVLEAEETIDIFLGQALKVKIGFLTTSVHSSFCRT